jgi:hypothetical protein
MASSNDTTTVMLESLQTIIKELKHQRIKEQSTVDDIQLPRGAHVTAPDAYRGTRTAAAVENWIYALTCYFELVGMNQTQSVSFAVNLVRDDASLWWQQYSQSPDTPGVEEFGDFCRLLRREFKPSNAEALARQQLQTLKQAGTIAQYISIFRGVMRELPDMNDKDAVFQFLQGLTYVAKLQVMYKEPNTLEEAYKHAEYFEMVQTTARGVVVQQTPVYFKQPEATNTDTATPMDLDYIKQVTTDHINSLFQRNGVPGGRNGRNYANMTCFYCGKTGHTKRKCRTREADIAKLDEAKMQKKQDFRRAQS